MCEHMLYEILGSSAVAYIYTQTEGGLYIYRLRVACIYTQTEGGLCIYTD